MQQPLVRYGASIMKQGFLIALLLGLITSLHAEPYKTPATGTG